MFAALAGFEKRAGSRARRIYQAAGFENGKLDLTEAEGLDDSDSCRHRPAAAARRCGS